MNEEDPLRFCAHARRGAHRACLIAGSGARGLSSAAVNNTHCAHHNNVFCLTNPYYNIQISYEQD